MNFCLNVISRKPGRFHAGICHTNMRIYEKKKEIKVLFFILFFSYRQQMFLSHNSLSLDTVGGNLNAKTYNGTKVDKNCFYRSIFTYHSFWTLFLREPRDLVNGKEHTHAHDVFVCHLLSLPFFSIVFIFSLSLCPLLVCMHTFSAVHTTERY